MLAAWLALLGPGSVKMYIGYGFVMSAIAAQKSGKSDPWVVKLDTAIALYFIAWDALLNLVVYPVVCLDLRPKSLFKKVIYKGRTIYLPELITGRLSRYNEDPDEWQWRRAVANFGAGLLDGKDTKGDHITGPNTPVKWPDLRSYFNRGASQGIAPDTQTTTQGDLDETSTLQG
jgi:hypothetical protein